MEHFELDFIVHDKTIQQLCDENNISLEVFICFANLYNGYRSTDIEKFNGSDIASIVLFLKNTHNYYENEKYPEIRNYIQQLYAKNNSAEIKLIEKFFDEYFEEVKEHLYYEDHVAFPYFTELIMNKNLNKSDKDKFRYSVKDYREHHSDIETALNDLKELLLKHIPVKDDRVLRRKTIMSLCELENDLNIHSTIEELILIPLVSRLEKKLFE
jgi:regulator of cell morphogenesis and NO signaling